jgi:hypothetical protein
MGNWELEFSISRPCLPQSPSLYRKEGRVDAHPVLLNCEKLQLLDGSSYLLVFLHSFLVLCVAAQDTEIY